MSSHHRRRDSTGSEDSLDRLIGNKSIKKTADRLMTSNRPKRNRAKDLGDEEEEHHLDTPKRERPSRKQPPKKSNGETCDPAGTNTRNNKKALDKYEDKSELKDRQPKKTDAPKVNKVLPQKESSNEKNMKKSGKRNIVSARKKRAISSDDDTDATDEETVPKKVKRVQEKNVSKETDGMKSSYAPSLGKLIAELEGIDTHIAHNIVKLFEADNTIPFLCRYRKEMIGNASPEKMRSIKASYKSVLQIRSKAESVIKTLKNKDNLTDELFTELMHARSLDEIEEIYAPYKQGRKKLAHRAKEAGLSVPAMNMIENVKVNLDDYISSNREETKTYQNVCDGIKNIISDFISLDVDMNKKTAELSKTYQIVLSVEQNKNMSKVTANVDPRKFKNYFQFRNSVNRIRPHQALAINRGEKLNVLKVKLDIPDTFKKDLKRFFDAKFQTFSSCSQQRREILLTAFEDAFTRFKKNVCRRTRTSLTKSGETASLNVFANNLKQLLLMSPVQGQKILGIDPGFAHGCKIALISENGNVLETGIIYPFTQSARAQEYGEQCANMLEKYSCNLIGIGNGKACRETEAWITQLYNNRTLDPDIVKYCIVPEQGVSVYSCGDEAKKEFPKMSVNLVGAVAIARRLCDPLGEYVKVEPRHLGIGMYQHDVNAKHLEEILDEVVMECVSYIGVDVNTASVCLLKHIAGLTATRAESIFNHRSEHGPFASRKDLLKVKSIGAKSFQQCAGFIRIDPHTANCDKAKFNKLDCTWVHPESYDIAERLIKDNGFTLKDIGTEKFILKMKSLDCDRLARDYNVTKEQIATVVNALQREMFKDYRSDINKQPLFKRGLTLLSDLKKGTIVTGSVSNVTDFGCFVDIGVEADALAHSSALNSLTPMLYDRVEATIVEVDLCLKQIKIALNCIL